MKARFLHGAALWTFLFAATLTTGCSDDNDYKDVDGQNPTLELVSEHVHSNPGKEARLVATITDADGIRSIRLRNADLYLDKTIDLLEIYGEPLTTYKLEYAITLSEELPRMTDYPIIITVTDIGGRTIDQTIIVSTDNDSTKPSISFMAEGEVTAVAAEDGTIPYHFIVEDEQAIDYVEVSVPALDIMQRFEAEGKTRIDGFVGLAVQSGVTYEIALKVVDTFANEASTTASYKVNIVSEMPDFQKMYLSDVEDLSQLTSDVFGVPMRIERTGAYTYKANYYSEKAGTEIYFIPQKTDLYPIRFGKDPGNPDKLTSDPSLAEPIVLDQAHVYYEFTFNIQNGSYTMRTYSIDEAIDPIPHVYGSETFDVWANGEWITEFRFGYMTGKPYDIQRFTQDKLNSHLFYLEPLQLKANQRMNFAIHNWHSSEWWDYCSWYVDTSNGGSANDPEVFGYYGNAKNPEWTKPKLSDSNRSWATPTVKNAGDYKLVFDAHLERAKLIPAN